MSNYIFILFNIFNLLLSRLSRLSTMEEEQVIQILGALEDIRANYKRRCSQLSRQMQSLALLHTIGQKEEMYVALYRMMQEVTRLI